MRIEAYSQVQQVYQTKKTNKALQSASVSQSDQLQISSLGKDFQTAKAAVAASPDVRAELTDSIKVKVQNGTYEVDNGTFAEKLLQKYEEMR
ncbi:MAG: flagellar biosynthesis anti-sigma factor FlgM [Acetatifactor sp.]|nr:flagellar biosynthesis anti-sigma factor FlgM [Acetatifactor sp.]